VAVETHHLARPVNVLGGQARHVGLCATQVPAIRCKVVTPQVVIPTLEDYERKPASSVNGVIVPMPLAVNQ
jgi:hypothetical protein